MTKVGFVVTFKDDIVLNTNSATTMGLSDTLDYIPGSNFLGILAANGGYEEFGEKSFQVFHSGAVRFGDAHIFHKERSSLKLPYSYFVEKGKKMDEEAKVYIHHLLDKKRRDELKKQGIQLKQVRSGYFNTDNKIESLHYSYTQKSSYDIKTRRSGSEDSDMFGYNAIVRGSEFYFEVNLEDVALKDTIVKIFEKDEKRLGKTKNNQYGRITIKQTDEIDQVIKQQTIQDKTLYLYAKSNLALVDTAGNPLSTPDLTSLKLPDTCKINFENSQIRQKLYSSYNFKRQTRDYERIIIEKGSVIAIDLDEHFKLDEYKSLIKKGVGNFLSEGFGEILTNPSFLFEAVFTKADVSPRILGIEVSKANDTNLIEYLDKQKKQKEIDKKLIAEAFKNRDKFASTTTSQWGKIRSLATQFGDDKILSELDQYLNNGVAKEKWKNHYATLETLITNDKFKNHKSKFTRLLAMEVSRYLKQGDKNGK